MSLPLPGSSWLRFKVEGKPVPWGVDVISRGKRGALTLQTRSRDYQRRIGRAAWAALYTSGRPQFKEPVEVEVVGVLARVKRLRGEGRHLAPVSPDADRILRNVLDGLHQYTPTGILRDHAGIIWDDSRVVRTEVVTLYAAEGEKAATHVRLRSISGLEEVQCWL